MPKPQVNRPLQLTCPHCNGDIRNLLQGWYHAGLSNVMSLQCEACYGNAVVDGWARAPGWDDRKTVLENQPKLEEALVPCMCGGRFTVAATPKCPLCNQSIESLLPHG